MNTKTINMEDYFEPGFKLKPAIHVGSQSHKLFHGNPMEQAWEGFHLAAATPGDIVVVRDYDKAFLDYWKSLMGDIHIINLPKDNTGDFLTEVILNNPKLIAHIKKHMANESHLMVFLPTKLEKELANKLEIDLHGTPEISDIYGTKSGIRVLSEEIGLEMPPAYICKTFLEVKKGLNQIFQQFDDVVVKHDLSLSGYFSKKLLSKPKNDNEIASLLNEICGGTFTEGKDIVVVEGWIKNKASLCVHIEILKDNSYKICGGWQQIIDKDGTTYLGGGPLNISDKALSSLIESAHKLAEYLSKKNARGSYAPDFLVVADDETHLEPDTCALIELNARVPYTAFPLEIVKQVRGKIGSGFCSKHIKLSQGKSFTNIKRVLEDADLLITKKDTKARGVVPFNIGLLPWGIFDIVAMADTWEETRDVVLEVDSLFKKREVLESIKSHNAYV